MQQPETKRAEAAGGSARPGSRNARSSTSSESRQYSRSDLARAREALQFISPSHRDTWVRMGMAIKSEFGEEGRDAWDSWSQQDETTYSAGDARDVWKSLRTGGGIGIGSLYHEAKAGGWRDDNTRQKPTADELAERRRVAAERAQREEVERTRERAEAARKAAALWAAAGDANASHAYLTRKGIAPVLSMRQISAKAAAEILGYHPKSDGEHLAGELLLIPIKVAGSLSTLELIDETGRKASIAGGQKAGGFWAPQAMPDDSPELVLLIGEGAATTLSASAASGHPAVAALASGNLIAVATDMRERYPTAALVLLADLTKKGSPDPHAIDAAAAVHGALAVPEFGPNRAEGQKDFNDLARIDSAAVAESIAAALAPEQDANLHHGAGMAEVFAAARAAKSKRPVIDIRTGDLPTTIDGCERALIAAGAPIYARGEMLARAVPAPLEPGNVKRAAGALILTAVTIAALQDDLEKIADFQRWITGPNGPEPKPADAPAKACRALLDRVGRWRFPQLRGIALAPFIRADGTVACTPGYDPESGLLLAIPSDWPAPPSNPTRTDALAALARLRHLIRTFAFVTPEDESVAIAAMLSPLVRPAIEAAPMFGYSAPVRGSGKSMLADLVAVLATGRPATAMTWGPDADENAKVLASALLAGDAVVMLDNVETPLRGELLCSALTQSSLRLRPLGRSELVTIPCVATLLATGNALTPAGDMTRRVLVAELDPQCERPELREFTNDPKADALAERAELVNACLTIIKAGMRSDYRRPAPLGSYGQWSRLVRDPLIWLGMPDPITVMERTFDQDPEREAAIGILAAWREVYGDSTATAAEAVKAAKTHAGLSDALESIAARTGTISTRSFGRWLSRHKGRVLGGLKVQQLGGNAKNGIRWRVVEHGVIGDSGVSYTASRTEGGTDYKETKTQRPDETPETRETPPASDADEWGDVA